MTIRKMLPAAVIIFFTACNGAQKKLDIALRNNRLQKDKIARLEMQVNSLNNDIVSLQGELQQKNELVIPELKSEIARLRNQLAELKRPPSEPAPPASPDAWKHRGSEYRVAPDFNSDTGGAK